MHFEDLTVDIATDYSEKIAAHIEGFDTVLFEGLTAHRPILDNLYEKKQVR